MQKRTLVKIKLSVIAFTAIFAVIVFYGFSAKFQKVSASATGPTPSHTNAPGESNCTECHTSFPVNSGTGNVIISGIPANYKPNQQIPITVTVNQEQAVVFGFQLTAIDSQGRKVGTFTLPQQEPQELQILQGIVDGHERDYVEHNVNGVIPTQFDTKSWSFTFTAPAQRVGKIGFYAAGNGANSDGIPDGDYIYTTSKASLSGTAISNFDGDTASDIAVFRPSTGVWYNLNSSNGGFQAVQFGASGDVIAPGDYDGDGKNDLAVFRPSTGVWYILQSSNGNVIIRQFGLNGDIPVVGDYDGDLKTDIAVWRPSSGVWYIWRSSDNAFDFRTFGVSTDKIAQGDYDADGKTDIAVFRPSTGVWYIWKSSDNNFLFIGFGLDGDKPVQGDYDGDGKTDIAVFRPSNSVFYIQRSTGGFTSVQWGIPTDKPVPADYDGDGKTDIAVYRPSNGGWYALRSSDNSFTAIGFGLAEDKPVPGGYISE